MYDHKRPPAGAMPGRGIRINGGEKPRDFIKAMGRLIAYSKKYAPAILTAALLALIGTTLNIVGPGKLSEMTNLITDGLKTGIDIAAVQKIAALLLVFYGCGFLCNLCQGVIMATVTQRIAKSLRAEIAQKINRVPLKYFDGAATGDVLSRVTNDVDTIGQTLNQSLGTLLNAVILFSGSLVMMLYTNRIMGLSGAAASLLGFAAMLLLISRSQKYFMRQQQELGRLDGHIEETYAGHNVVRAYNGEKEAKRVFSGMNRALYACAWKSQFLSGLMQPLMSFTGNFGYVVVCVVGAALAVRGQIPFGTIVAFMLYIRLFTQPLSQFAQAATGLQSAAAASERVFEFLNEEEMADEAQKTAALTTARGKVEFTHVRFSYVPGRAIIKDFTAEIKAGQKVAIVGPTGAGKTTLVNLLMRFYEIDGGEIAIDGVSTRLLTRENVHDLFGMVLQDTWLFEGTIAENMIYNKEGVTEEAVIAAGKTAGLHHFVQTLPQGYATVLCDEADLSAGQKQLVTIARAMIKNAPILILDEATSSVDTRTEALIQRAMDKLMEGRTSFVIAHRLSTVRNADLILVMKDGDILESGVHEELLQKKGFYADLYNSQFGTV